MSFYRFAPKTWSASFSEDAHPRHVFKERSDALVVTNANTRREQFDAIQDFMQESDNTPDHLLEIFS
jgi:hypothetical protein